MGVPLTSHVVAFDERRSSPLTNLGTLGATGDATATGTKSLTFTGTRYAYLPGVASNYLSTTSAATLNITGDIEIVVRVALDDWTPAATSALIGKYGNTGNISWRVVVLATGVVRFTFSTDGTALTNKDSTVATGFTDGTAYWLKVTMDVDNGAAGYDVKFYTAADADAEPTSWTQLGSTVTTATATSIFVSTQALEIGTSTTGAASPAAGKFYNAIVRSGIGGSTVFSTSIHHDNVDADDTSYTCATGQTVTINRSTGATYKTAVVTSGVRLFNGSSDLLTVADNASLDFGASDSFTVWALIRQWSTPNNNGRWVAKGGGVNPRWGILSNTTSLQVQFQTNDGTNNAADATGTFTAGATLLAAGVLNRSAATTGAYRDGVLDSPATSSSAVGSLAGSEALTVGGQPTPASYQAFELYAWGVYAGVMTATQLVALKADLIQGTGTGPRTANLSVPVRAVTLGV